MKISEVVASAIRIPRSSLLTTSYGSESWATTVLVEVSTDEGITGIGQASVDAPFYGESLEGMLANVRAHLAPAVIGENPLDITRLNAKMRAALPSHWFSHSGVEMALWDLKGKALGAPPSTSSWAASTGPASPSWDSCATTPPSRWRKPPPKRSIATATRS